MRDGKGLTILKLLYQLGLVTSLPMRDGKIEILIRSRIPRASYELTYEGWKGPEGANP